jgi:nicotinamide riboside transporter PnuC
MENKRDYVTMGLTFMAIVGAVLNASQYMLPAFSIWIVTNIAFAYITYKRGFKEQVPLWIVYNIISVWGILNALKIVG